MESITRTIRINTPGCPLMAQVGRSRFARRNRASAACSESDIGVANFPAQVLAETFLQATPALFGPWLVAVVASMLRIDPPVSAVWATAVVLMAGVLIEVSPKSTSMVAESRTSLARIRSAATIVVLLGVMFAPASMAVLQEAAVTAITLCSAVIVGAVALEIWQIRPGVGAPMCVLASAGHRVRAFAAAMPNGEAAEGSPDVGITVIFSIVAAFYALVVIVIWYSLAGVAGALLSFRALPSVVRYWIPVVRDAKSSIERRLRP